MLKRTLKRLKSFRPLRRLVIIAGIVASYFIFIGLISEIVDQRAIEQEVKDWFERSLGFSTYVNIDHTDTALRSDWRTDLYIHEFEIASPNPEYILPLVSIDTIRASSNFYSLFGGVSATPVIQLRDAILNIEQMPDRSFNFSSIKPTAKLPNLNFLPNINVSSIDFLLMNCNVMLKVAGMRASIPINGKVQVTDDNIQINTSSQSSRFKTISNGVTKDYRGNIYIRNLISSISSKDIKRCDIALEDIPLASLSMLIPALPKLPTGLNITGSMQVIGNAIVFTGQVENLSIPTLPRYFDLKMSTNRSFLFHLEYYFIELSENNIPLFTLKAQNSPTGAWEPLQLYFASIDIDKILSGSDSEWLSYLTSTFPAINVIASSALLANFEIGEALFNIVKSESGSTDISLDGNIASGKLTLLARDISLSSTSLPKTVMATLEIKDAADTLVKFSKSLPRILDCTPSSGNGEIALLYQRNDDDSTQDTIKVQLRLKDVVIPTLSSSEAISALAMLPTNLSRLSTLCNVPRLSQPQPDPKFIESFSEITFDSLSVSYETISDKTIRLSAIEAKSKELGILHGKLFKLDHDNLQLQLSISNIPSETIERSKLNDDSMNAVNTFTINNPLKINLIESNRKIKVENLYLEDIYRNWLDEQTLAGIQEPRKE